MTVPAVLARRLHGTAAALLPALESGDPERIAGAQREHAAVFDELRRALPGPTDDMSDELRAELLRVLEHQRGALLWSTKRHAEIGAELDAIRTFWKASHSADAKPAPRFVSRKA